MKGFIVGSLVAFGLMSSPASADIANLTGHYICVKNCSGKLWHSAYVTQNGWDLNLLTEANVPIRAQTDWFSPNRIWVGPGTPVLCTHRTALSFSSTMG